MSENKNKSYLKAFQNLKEKGSDAFILNGDCLIVEEVAQEEYKSSSGIVIAKSIDRRVDTIEDNRPMLVRVLLAGAGYYDEETGKDIPLDIKEGDILLIGKLGVKWLSSIGSIFLQDGGTRIGLTRESEIQMRYKGQEGYDRVSQLLKEGM